MKNSIIIGSGGYLPKKIMTNEDFVKLVDTSNEWIIERTGILSRHIADKNENTTDLAYEAAKDAIKTANINPKKIDLIIVATVTPERTLPSTASHLQGRLGTSSGVAFDISAACTGFISALSVANNYLILNQAKTALIIGADTYSRIINMKDRNTCILFGDGAGAIILQRTEENKKRGVLGTFLHSDGNYTKLLYTDGGVSSTCKPGYIKMEGRELFRHAVDKLHTSALNALKTLNLNTSDINWFIPHQANIRIIKAIAKKLNIPEKQIIITLDTHANTSAASIPLALNKGIKDGKVKHNDLILHEAFGAGLTWGSAIIKY